jgi:hypothetical protein
LPIFARERVERPASEKETESMFGVGSSVFEIGVRENEKAAPCLERGAALGKIDCLEI